MTTSSPVRLVGCNDKGPSDPVRIINFEDLDEIRAPVSFGDGDGNQTAIEENGFLRLDGEARAWIDYNFGVGSVTPGATAPDKINLNATNIQVYAYNGVNITEEVDFTIEMNHNWAEGTTVYPHVHWYPTTNGAGGVVWSLEYVIVPEGSVVAIGASSTTIKTTAQSAGGTAWVPKFVNFPAITMTGNKIGTQCFFRFFRDPADDDYAADAAVGTIGLHVLLDTLGSRKIAEK